MHHLAIMQKETGFLSKIASGSKTIESRWYLHRRAPWNKIKAGDIIYFKNTGELVSVQAEVERVEQYTCFVSEEKEFIVRKNAAGLGLEKNQIEAFIQKVQNKKYAILIHVTKVKPTDPFNINKAGFGTQSAWITVESIDKIKL